VGIINKQDIIKVWEIAFSIASLTMFQKICQVASLLSLLLSMSMIGGSYYAFRFVTSEQFKAKVMNEIMENVSGLIPKALDQGLPKTTGVSIPFNGN
tara:strand:+ start:725 stop:1015 length:291 start_codon:yes stop_codon:yes gene_type:complete